MKYEFATILSFLLPVLLFSQKPSNNYNTKVNNANTVNIYGNGKIEIGKIIVNSGIKTKILLTDVSQTIDSSELYVTTFKFENSEGVGIPFLAINIMLNFDSPVLEVKYRWFGNSASMDGVYHAYNEEKTAFQFKVSKFSTDSFALIVTSKKKVKTEIAGIDGKSS